MNALYVGNWIIRFKASGYYLAAIAGIVLAHTNLLHLGSRYNDLVELICLVLIGLNNPVASQMLDRK